jgi:hypothetical protein
MVPKAEIKGNVEAIKHVPRAVLPDGEARDTLMALARQGEDLYVYQAASLRGNGVWNVWIESLARRRRPECNGRVALSEWCTSWRELVAEAGMEVRP